MKPRTGQIRIVGGEFRSRRLRFPAVRDLRPTPDAIRETLFNWLRQEIENSICLDLFAGSGALGIEALSRGAAAVTLVEANRSAARQLRDNIELIGAGQRARVLANSAARFLRDCTDRYDIVFMDPPYEGDLLKSSIDLLCSRNLLAENALLYIETRTHNPPLPIPPSWHIIRSTDCGLVQAYLIQTNPLASNVETPLQT